MTGGFSSCSDSLPSPALWVQRQTSKHLHSSGSIASVDEGSDPALNGKHAGHSIDHQKRKPLNPTYSNQFVALLEKRYINSKRHFMTTFCQLCCPLFYLLIFVGFLKASLIPFPKLELRADQHYNLENEDAGARARAYYSIRGSDADPDSLAAQSRQANFVTDRRIRAVHARINGEYMSETVGLQQTCPWPNACPAPGTFEPLVAETKDEEEDEEAAPGTPTTTTTSAVNATNDAAADLYSSFVRYGGCPWLEAQKTGQTVMGALGIRVLDFIPALPYWSTNSALTGANLGLFSALSTAGGITTLFGGASNIAGINNDESVRTSVKAKHKDLDRFDFWAERQIPKSSELEAKFGM